MYAALLQDLQASDGSSRGKEYAGKRVPSTEKARTSLRSVVTAGALCTHQIYMDFRQFLELDQKYLNLGALKNTHPSEKYKHYIGINPPGKFQNKVVDLDTGKLVLHPDNKPGTDNRVWTPRPFAMHHDIELPFPLPTNSVDRLHSEDCFEHIELTQYPRILEELHRILKPGGRLRLAVPDYRNPKDRFCLEKGFDPRNNLHITLTTYELLKPVLDASPFTVDYLHYWKDDDTFVQNDIDYSKGYVRRTPDNDERNKGADKLHVTSFVCDLIKTSEAEAEAQAEAEAEAEAQAQAEAEAEAEADCQVTLFKSIAAEPGAPACIELAAELLAWHFNPEKQSVGIKPSHYGAGFIASISKLKEDLE